MFRACGILFFILTFSHSAAAQILYGSLVGNVTDESRAGMAGATVTITNTGTEFTRTGATNNEGRYSFPNIPDGTYTVAVKMAGFADFTESGVVVGVNTTVRVDARMAIAGVQTAVTVTAASEVAQLQTDRGEIRHDLGAEEFENLPVSLAGNYQSLLQAIPGVEVEGDFRPGRLGGTNSSGSVAFSVNGTTTSTTATNVSPDRTTRSHSLHGL